MSKEYADMSFEDWWASDGRYIDPDTSDIPWFDKRKELCGIAYTFAHSQALDRIEEFEADHLEAFEYLARLLRFQYPEIHLLDDLVGRCTQLDNVMAGMTSEYAALEAKNAEMEGAFEVADHAKEVIAEEHNKRVDELNEAAEIISQLASGYTGIYADVMERAMLWLERRKR